MGVSRWLADRRADDVSHGIPGRLAYTALTILVGLGVYTVVSILSSLLAIVVTGFVALFAGIPFLVKVWSPTPTALRERQRLPAWIDPEPGPRELKAPKRW